MGTNFYIRGFGHSDDPKDHIGKRSAAGLYCWTCMRTLCVNGPTAVHQGRSDWWKRCPKCDAAPEKENLEESAAGRELGFNKKPLARKGVRSVCSFSWAMDPKTLLEQVKRALPDCPHCHRAYDAPGAKDEVIEDEYGTLYTLQQFTETILADCPIQSFDSIGQYFC